MTCQASSSNLSIVIPMRAERKGARHARLSRDALSPVWDPCEAQEGARTGAEKSAANSEIDLTLSRGLWITTDGPRLAHFVIKINVASNPEPR